MNMVSFENLGKIQGSPRPSRGSTTTPLDSFKRLDQGSRDESKLQPYEPSRNFYNQEGPLPKRFKTSHADNEGASLLHRGCAQGMSSTIISALKLEPSMAGIQNVVPRTKRVFNYMTRSFQVVQGQEPYAYPLNLAIQHGAATHALDALMDAAPYVLGAADGVMGESPLMVLLKYRPCDVDVADTMLLKHPFCVQVRDRHDNTALHWACVRGAPLSLVRHLCILFPEALLLRNFHGQTPLDLARRHTVACSETVVNYLWDKHAEQLMSHVQ